MLQEKLKEDFKVAFKAGDTEKRDTLRYLSSQIQNKEIEKRGKGDASPLTEEEVLDLLTKEAKKRQEAIELFTKGDRADLAEKEQKELVIIQAYLPAQLTREEVAAIIDEVIAAGANDFSSAMKEISKKTKGRADGKLVAELVKTKLG